MINRTSLYDVLAKYVPASQSMEPDRAADVQRHHQHAIKTAWASEMPVVGKHPSSMVDERAGRGGWGGMCQWGGGGASRQDRASCEGTREAAHQDTDSQVHEHDHCDRAHPTAEEPPAASTLLPIQQLDLEFQRRVWWDRATCPEKRRQ